MDEPKLADNNKLHKTSLVLFDFDGTLVDLNIDFDIMRKKLKGFYLEKYGEEHEFRPLLEKITELGSKKDCLCELQNLHSKLEIELSRTAQVVEGASETLNHLKAKGIKIGIFSRNSAACIKHHIKRNAFPEFDVILGYTDIRYIKPHPDAVNFALEKLSINKNEAVVVGDKDLDITAGNTAGVFTVALERDWSKGINLADAVIDKLSELKHVI